MPEPQPAASGTSILVVMSVATVVLTAAIAGFCALEVWWLLPVIVLSLVCTAAGVVAYLFRVMGDDDAELAGHWLDA
jgi:hypothetical protein